MTSTISWLYFSYRPTLQPSKIKAKCSLYTTATASLCPLKEHAPCIVFAPHCDVVCQYWLAQGVLCTFAAALLYGISVWTIFTHSYSWICSALTPTLSPLQLRVVLQHLHLCKSWAAVLWPLKELNCSTLTSAKSCSSKKERYFKTLYKATTGSIP